MVAVARFRIALIAFAVVIASPAPAAEPADLKDLPAGVAKLCGTPTEWVTVAAGDEIRIQPPPDADYNKVDCILGELKARQVTKLGFVGNEADPNRVLRPAWSYIAGGRIDVLTTLAQEVRKAGWVVDKLARSDDGTGFLLFHSPEGMTYAQADPFATRLWEHRLGDITFGKAPTVNGGAYEGD